MVPVRDCVQLATDIYLPNSTGPFPTLLVRIPYDKERGMKEFPFMKILAYIFRAAGYAVVIQDTRGKFASEGEWHPFLHEQDDGLDTVKWLEVQPWFDGNLGLVGGSYFGFTQLAIAHQQPSCLKAMVPMVISSNIYSWLFESGLPRADIAVNWALGSWKGDDFDALPDSWFAEAALHWPLAEGDDHTVGDLNWFDDWLANPFQNGFYERYIPADALERIQVPTLMITGWYDIFLAGQLADFQVAQKSETAPGNARIVIGPWTHTMGVLEDHDYPFRTPKSLVSFLGHILNWFGHFLKGEPLVEGWGPVHVYDPGTGRWDNRAALWPEKRSESVFYLSGNQGAATCTPMGRLAKAPVKAPGALQYTYDPLAPVIRYGGALLGMENGCLLEEAACDRADVLTFVSTPLARSMTLEGEISLELPVSSSAPDTTFVGRLSLVKLDCRAYFLRQGVVTLSHREGDAVQAPYAPGEVVDVRIQMPPLLWTLKPGERLRLEISSSSFPSVVQHPNVAEDWFTQTNPMPAEQTIHLLPDRPARLVLKIRGTWGS